VGPRCARRGPSTVPVRPMVADMSVPCMQIVSGIAGAVVLRAAAKLQQDGCMPEVGRYSDGTTTSCLLCAVLPSLTHGVSILYCRPWQLQ
jgi:hypothetical protein